MTDTQTIFGYGSLVNMATHMHVLTPATAIGWRRVWREIPGRDFAILSVTRDPDAQIAGGVMSVSFADLPALDAREMAYVRMTTELANNQPHVAIYEVQAHAVAATKPILRSYLDVVLAGYEAFFGAEALPEFYETTADWHVGIFDDRAEPIYPRHKILTPAQLTRYDQLHRELTA